MTYIRHFKNNDRGFALLISLIVVSVVISIGLTILDLTLKQLKLSTNSKDSETAFHAANAGLECARYWRNSASADLEKGNSFNPECFNAAEDMGTISDESSIDVPEFGGDAYIYSFESTWGTAPTQRCSEMKILVIVSDISDNATVSETEMTDAFPGYPEGEKVCPPGGLCTVISSKGYSRSCAGKTIPGTVQREVLLEL